jgi:hypothetical protein
MVRRIRGLLRVRTVYEGPKECVAAVETSRRVISIVKWTGAAAAYPWARMIVFLVVETCKQPRISIFSPASICHWVARPSGGSLTQMLAAREICRLRF